MSKIDIFALLSPFVLWITSLEYPLYDCCSRCLPLLLILLHTRMDGILSIPVTHRNDTVRSQIQSVTEPAQEAPNDLEKIVPS